MKRIIALALAVCLTAALLSGCKGTEEQQTRAMGRYVEQQVQTLEADRVQDLRLDENGDLVFYMTRQEGGSTVVERCTLPAAGGELTKTPIEWLRGTEDLSNLRISESADGWVYAVAQDMTGGSSLLRCAPGGQPETVPTPDWGQGAVGISLGGDVAAADAAAADVEAAEKEYMTPERQYPYGIQALPGGSFLIYYGMAGASRYDASGQLTGEFEGGNFQGAAVYNGTLLLGSSDGKGFWSYDLETGKPGPTHNYEGMGMSRCLGMDAEGLYLGDSSGIYRQAVGGSVWEKLVDGGLTSLSMPSVTLSGLVSDGDGGFWAVLAEGLQFQLVRYGYDAETPAAPDTELTIFGLTENKTVAQAIGEFQRRNPNVRINYRVGLEDGSAATAEEVIRALNTELVAGKGPDLLLLDGLPMDSYMEKGVLADLTELVDGLDGLMTNLMHAYESGGKIYGVPSRFTLPVMMGKRDDVAAMRSLGDLADQVASRQNATAPFLYVPPELWEDGGILMRYYNACAGTFSQGGVDQAALTSYLLDMTAINGKLRETAPQTGTSAVTMVISASGTGGYEPLDNGATYLGLDEAQFHVQELAGSFSLQSILDNLGKKDGFVLDALFGGDRYTPVGGVGIVAGSSQQALAQEFLKMLLSETVQDSYLYDGFPVNRDSLERMVNETVQTVGGQNDMGFLELCHGVQTPILIDQVVKDAVEDQTKALADGTLTPQQAAATVVEKTKLYLSE